MMQISLWMNVSDAQRIGAILRENPQFVLIGWLSLGVVSWLFFHLVQDAPLKRFLFPLWMFAVAGLVLGLSAVMFGIRREMAYVAVPAVILISLLNILTTRFCDHCGRTLIRQPLRSRFCPYCGESLS